MSTIKRIFDRDAILTYSAYFPGCPPSLLTNLRSVKGTNVGVLWLGGAYARVFYIKGFGTKGANTEGICTVGGFFGGTYIRSVCIGGACDVGNYIRGAGVGGICSSAYKSTKSSIWCSRLLVESTSKMPVSSCLHLQFILDKVL